MYCYPPPCAAVTFVDDFLLLLLHTSRFRARSAATGYSRTTATYLRLEIQRRRISSRPQPLAIHQSGTRTVKRSSATFSTICWRSFRAVCEDITPTLLQDLVFYPGISWHTCFRPHAPLPSGWICTLQLWPVRDIWTSPETKPISCS